VGANKCDLLNLAASAAIFAAKSKAECTKLLDTSVIIDVPHRR